MAYVNEAESVANSITFSVNLLHKVSTELDFLKKVDEKQIYYEPDVIECAVYRYEKLWLPMLLARGEEGWKLKPPLDVHWVWHVHMLSPKEYASDCMKLFKTVFGHGLGSKKTSAEKLWEDTYPDEPFEITREQVEDRSVLWSAHHSELRYNILEAAQRQKVFYYQVSLPHYRNAQFLQEAMLRYKKYLALKSLNKDTFLVPCYDIDLIWHTHQVHPLEYAEDCQVILGFTLPHDDSVNDRNEGSKLNNSYQVTIDLWKSNFKASFTKPGAMYRGAPPDGKLFPLTADRVRQIKSFKRFDIKVRQLEIDSFTWPEPEDAQVIAYRAAYRHGRQHSRKEIYSQTWKLGEGTTSFKLDRPIFVSVCDFETHVIEVDISSAEKKGFLCCAKYQDIASLDGQTGLRLDNLEDGQTLGVSAKLKLFDEKRKSFVHSEVGARLSATCTLIKAEETRDTTLGILPGTFYDAVMPETVESMWGPVPMKRLPEGDENKCKAVVHRYLLYHLLVVRFSTRSVKYSIIRENGAKEMSVYVIHSLPTMMSVVQIFVEEKMSMVCHLVSADTIGYEETLGLNTQVTISLT
jgi:hypothetical protein